jgi:hypothetical protein
MVSSSEVETIGVTPTNSVPLKIRLRQTAGRLRMATNFMLGRQVLDPGQRIYTDDTWYVSYPRSGNTYWRFLTANLISQGVTVDWTNIERFAPDIYMTFDVTLRRLPRPRYIKSHEPFKPAYRRVVLIVRDPRDVAVSCFHMAKRWYVIPEDRTIDDFIPDWIAGKIFAYGNWGEYHGSWLGARRGTDDFWVFRYEDMVADPATHLARLVDVLQLPAIEKDIQRAIENSTPDRLRELERKQKNSHKLLKYGRSTTPYVRAATTKQWSSALSQQSIKAIESAWPAQMQEFGYL